MPNERHGEHGKFARKPDAPLVNFQITNPVTILKAWWGKVIGNEGVDVRLKIHPLTAIAIALAFGGLGVGLGRLTVPEPIAQLIPALAPTPTATPSSWIDAAYVGILRASTSSNKYYLQTGDGKTVPLEVQINVNLSKYVGRRIFAIGQYNSVSGILVVSESQDLEILPATPVPLATNPPATPFPSLTPTL
jgi:hypothetical protein